MTSGPSSPSESGTSLPAARRRSGTVLVLWLIGACAAAVGTFWLARPGKAPLALERGRAIAVLPFHSVGGAGQGDPGGALTDALVARLKILRRFSVRPAGAIRPLDDRAQDPVAAGRALGVDTVVEGRIRKSNGAARVVVQLIDVRKGRAFWSAHFDAPGEELAGLEEPIAQAMVRALDESLRR